MSDTIARQLAGLFRELAERASFSEIARVELTAAGASGHATRLLIGQCNSDDLVLSSFYRRWWVVDDAGLHLGVKWPLNQALVDQPGWLNEFPYIKFATDGRRVRFGMRLGDGWYASKEGPLELNGRFVPQYLVQIYCSVD